MPVRSTARKPSGGPFDHLPSNPDPHGAQTAPATSGAAPTTPSRSGRQPRRPVARTRAGAAWVGIVVAVAVLVLLIVFMLQNTAPVEVAFFGLRGTAPLSATLLIAGVGFALVTLIVGSLRIGQLRRRIGSGPDTPRTAGDRP